MNDAPTGYRARVRATTGEFAHVAAGRRRAEYAVRTDWGGYADTRGVQLDLTEYDEIGLATGINPTELTIEAAEQLGRDLLAAAAARRAHPPTAADEILAAYTFAWDERGGYWGRTWVPITDLCERLEDLPRVMVEAAVAEMVAAGDAELDSTATDPAEAPGGVEVEGIYYTRLRPAHLHRKES